MSDSHLYRPIIGVPTAEIPASERGEPGLWAMRKSYVTPLLAEHGLPIFLPQLEDLHQLDSLANNIDGLLLAGGADIDPAIYGQPPIKELEDVDHARDRTEIILIEWALENNLPILAICRGLQMVNVAAGGTLHQDIPKDLHLPTEHRQQPPSYQALAHHGHLITIASKSRLAQIVGHHEIWVNSMHHQAINRLGRDLKVTARSSDQVIEAIESKNTDHWLIGLQSHPEAMFEHDPWIKKLFREFIQAARDYHAVSHLVDA